MQSEDEIPVGEKLVESNEVKFVNCNFNPISVCICVSACAGVSLD
jgi:hypothetical protein